MSLRNNQLSRRLWLTQDQPIKLEIRSCFLLIEEKADRMHQQAAQQAIAQMPHIPRPDALHATAIRQLPKDGVDEVAHSAQHRTLVGCCLGRVRLAERRLQQDAFGSQEGLQIGQPIVAIPKTTLVVPSSKRGAISPSASLAGAKKTRVSRPGQLSCACSRKP